MSRTSVVSSLAPMTVLILATCRLATAWFSPSGGFVSPAGAEPQVSAREQAVRGPIRVGSQVMLSKLTSKVDPVYPALAAAARISGVVVVQVTVSEKGDVSDVKIVRGHPLLDQAVLDAVWQWRYAPFYLNGEPVAAVATALVNFGPNAQPAFVTVDASGTLRYPAYGAIGDAVVQKMKAASGPVPILAGSEVPTQILEQVLRGLQERGLRDLELRGAYLFRFGRVFYDCSRSESRIPGRELLPPELALDTERLAALARAGGPVDEIPRVGSTGPRILLYRLYINEVSEILAVELLRGPKLPEVEAQLAQTRVITPGRRGPDPVPAAAAVEIMVEE